MKRRRNTYWILILGLLLLSGAAEAVMTCYYESFAEQPLMFGSLFQIRPVYNESGSWIHARSGIGYRNGMLLAEHAVTLIVCTGLWRPGDIFSRSVGVGCMPWTVVSLPRCIG